MATPDKKEIILDAASKCFARYGYEKTTVEDIGKALRMNKASLYYYFPSKEEIFIQVVLRESARFMQGLQERVYALADHREKIQTYFRERVAYYRDVLNLHHLSLERLQEIEPVFDRVYESIRQAEVRFIAGMLELAAATGKIREEDPLQVAEMLFTVSDALKQEAFARSGLEDAGSVDMPVLLGRIQFALGLILNGLELPQDAPKKSPKVRKATPTAAPETPSLPDDPHFPETETEPDPTADAQSPSRKKPKTEPKPAPQDPTQVSLFGPDLFA